MCGRYRLTSAERFAEMTQVRIANTFPARYNIAPTQPVPAVLDEAPDLLQPVRWGLVPSWAKDKKIGSTLINARAESVATKPAYRAAFKRRRCLIPSDGFYEWMKSGAVKIPHHILMRDGEPFAFAGLWEIWRDPAKPDAEPLRTGSIVTCEANALVAPIHNRMPVILPRASYATWLSHETSPEECVRLLAPFPADLMQAHPISTLVNSPRNDSARIIDALPPVNSK